jgi:hypothetical protein
MQTTELEEPVREPRNGDANEEKYSTAYSNKELKGSSKN